MTRRYMKFLQQNILMRLRTDKSTLSLEKGNNMSLIIKEEKERLTKEFDEL